MAAIGRPFAWFYHEFGLDSVQETGRNAYLIILARSLRMLAYGTNALILGMSWTLIIREELNWGTANVKTSGMADNKQHCSSQSSGSLIGELACL